MESTNIIMIVILCLIVQIFINSMAYIFIKSKTIQLKSKQIGKKFDYSKVALTFSWIIIMIWITASYTLAFMEKDVNSEVTIAVITYGLVTVISYFTTKSFEKNSTNKYKTNENGVPYEVAYPEYFNTINNTDNNANNFINNENKESDNIDEG